MPVYATLFMIIMLASLGLPLLNGFVGEFTILVGAFLANWRWALFAGVGVILGAAYLLWLYQRVFFGELKHEENKTLQDVNLREVLTLAPLVLACVWIGVYPKPFFEMTAPASAKIVAAVETARGARTQAAAALPAAVIPAGVVPAAVVKGN
jgi:NADH-quinone oxidoreductase subunit M